MYTPEPHTRTLERSADDRRLGGVAGGLAQYFDVDPTLVRVLWLIAVPFTGGLALLAYLGLWLLLPEAGAAPDAQYAWSHGYGYGRPAMRGLGILFLAIGALILMGPLFHVIGHFGHVLFPLALVGLGIVLLLRHDHHVRPTLDL
ncbi:MAG TPA: PspC domain-containing protein [Chloroflexota bacterium]|nr:PspC domain-containing protein [Chloroflexota bacterium]